MDRMLMQYLPPVLQEVLELQTINNANEPEIIAAWDALARVMSNQFLSTADVNGVAKWEQELEIQPKNTDTLETRKARIKASWNLELPYTLPWLKNWLESICGEGNYSTEIEEGAYVLWVKLGLAAKDNFNDVEQLLERVVPANMLIKLSQLFNTHAELGAYTHAQLAVYTHDQLRNEVLS